MNTIRKKHIIAIVLILFLFVFLLVFFRPIYKELQFVLSDPSQAERTIKEYAKNNRIPYSAYPEDIIDLLERNTETEDFVLQYPFKENLTKETISVHNTDPGEIPLFLQWDTNWGYLEYGSSVAGITACGPLCLSMAAYYLTGDNAYAPWEMIRFARENGYYSWGNGTSWTLISEGAKALGFYVKELPLDENVMVKQLKENYPVICVVGPGDFTTSGHYIVLTGYENNVFTVNDPNSIKNSEKTWSYQELSSQIRNIWVIKNQ